MSTATITSKGQVTIPHDVRRRLGLRTGDKLNFQVEDDGSARIRPLSLRPGDVFGLLHGRVRRAATIPQMDAGVAEAFRKGNWALRETKRLPGDLDHGSAGGSLGAI